MVSCNSDNFSITNTPTVVYFGAPWCSSCPAVKAQLTDIEKKYADVAFREVDVTKDASISEAMRVMPLPTVILFNEGKELERFVGSTASKHLAKRLECVVNG